MTLESFSKVAADWIRLRRALYGPEEAQQLMRRCFQRSRSEKINETTVLACWQEMDDEWNAAIKGETA